MRRDLLVSCRKVTGQKPLRIIFYSSHLRGMMQNPEFLCQLASPENMQLKEHLRMRILMLRRMRAWITMVVAGKIKQPTSQPASSHTQDTFRGRVFECPLVDGVQFKGDGYTSCEASGPGRCKVNNGGGWHEAQDGHAYSSCTVSDLYVFPFKKKKKTKKQNILLLENIFILNSYYFSKHDDGEVKYKCPAGFKGDGVKSCEGNQRPAWGCKGTNGKADCHGWIWVDEYKNCGFTNVSASQPPKDTGVSNVADSSQGSAAPDLSQQSRPLDLVDEEPGNDYHSESSPDCTPAN